MYLCIDRGIFLRVFRTITNDFRSGALNVVRPVYKGRMVMLVIGNVCNWALAILGLYHHDLDFATYLLAIFMSNTLMYTLFYIMMKLCHRERIEWQAVLFIVLASLAWGFAMYFFRHKSISWAVRIRTLLSVILIVYTDCLSILLLLLVDSC